MSDVPWGYTVWAQHLYDSSKLTLLGFGRRFVSLKISPKPAYKEAARLEQQAAQLKDLEDKNRQLLDSWAIMGTSLGVVSLQIASTFFWGAGFGCVLWGVSGGFQPAKFSECSSLSSG